MLVRDWENNRFWTEWWQTITKFKVPLISSCLHASYRCNLKLGLWNRVKSLKGGKKVLMYWSTNQEHVIWIGAWAPTQLQCEGHKQAQKLLGYYKNSFYYLSGKELNPLLVQQQTDSGYSWATSYTHMPAYLQCNSVSACSVTVLVLHSNKSQTQTHRCYRLSYPSHSQHTKHTNEVLLTCDKDLDVCGSVQWLSIPYTLWQFLSATLLNHTEKPLNKMKQQITHVCNKNSTSSNTHLTVWHMHTEFSKIHTKLGIHISRLSWQSLVILCAVLWCDVLWVAYATHSTLKPVPTLPR